VDFLLSLRRGYISGRVILSFPLSFRVQDPVCRYISSVEGVDLLLVRAETGGLFPVSRSSPVSHFCSCGPFRDELVSTLTFSKASFILEWIPPLWDADEPLYKKQRLFIVPLSRSFFSLRKLFFTPSRRGRVYERSSFPSSLSPSALARRLVSLFL